MIDPDDTARWLILGAFVDILVTAFMVRAAIREDEPALNERASMSVLLTAIAIGAAFLGLARLHFIDMPPELGLLILSLGLLCVTVPQVVWFVAYVSGRFR